LTALAAVWLLLALVAAYLLGSIPSAFLIAKWRRGIDIRRFGSGNVGVSNFLASGSRWTSIIVFAFDFAKGSLPVVVARVASMPLYQQILVGIAAICGHNWTVFLRFSGGRGVLTTLGVIFAFAPWLAVTLLLINILWAPFKQFALGTFVVIVLLPICSWVLYQPFQIDRSITLTMGFVGMMLLLFIRRLTAHRSELASTVSSRELVVNRVLFDRDIRDRRAWLNRRVVQADSEAR
jgi:acyl phosphate:glycerol-3-phosphate acyltransferase